MPRRTCARLVTLRGGACVRLASVEIVDGLRAHGFRLVLRDDGFMIAPAQHVPLALRELIEESPLLRDDIWDILIDDARRPSA